MILDTTNLSGETSGSVVVEKWVWEWYQDALAIAKSQLAKLEADNKELREQVKHRDEYAGSLHKAFQDKCVANRLLVEENYKLRERVEELADECNRLADSTNNHWEYLEDVILGMVDASDNVRKVAKEIKQSRGTA